MLMSNKEGVEDSSRDGLRAAVFRAANGSTSAARSGTIHAAWAENPDEVGAERDASPPRFRLNPNRLLILGDEE
jgi:hypothetical protein